MKRASYRKAIHWVAYNDSSGVGDALNAQVVGELITAALIADLFGVPPEKVGEDVVRYRKEQSAWKEEGGHHE